MTEQEKQRINKEAEQYLATCSHAGDDNNLKSLYIAGATAEHERMAELLKEERRNAINEAISVIGLCLSRMTNIDGELIDRIESELESLKSQ